MSISLTIAIQKEDEWFVAKCIENNVASQGKTMDEAIINLREAITLYYDEEMPPSYPQTFETCMKTKLVMIEGIPGSGKSTYAKRLADFYTDKEIKKWLK